MARSSRQLPLNYRRHGGARPGAGAKPKGERAGVSHMGRPALASRFPVHVTLKLRKELGNLRRASTFRALRQAFHTGKERFGFRVVHFSVQRDHVHLICEAKHALALSRGMQGLCVRMARRLNKVWERKGAVFADRYHAQALKSPRQVRHALAYVLNNFRRHRENLGDVPSDLTDGYSSAPWFDGFRGTAAKPLPLVDAPITDARTWLLRIGWRRHARIGTWEVPGPTPTRPERVALCV